MKLIFCPKCGDVKKLSLEMTYCNCKESYGRYIDGLNAEINKVAIPIGINNFSFCDAIQNGKPTRELGERFEAFVISRDADSIGEIK